MFRSTHAAALLLTTLLGAGAAGVAQAATSATVIVQTGAPTYRQPAPGLLPVQYHRAPPPPRHEVVPPPRRGMVWAQGHWERRGHRDAWVPGRWIQARPGYVYRQPHWDQHGNRWSMQRGGWDRDGDGVPNRYDRRPNNPTRY